MPPSDEARHRAYEQATAPSYHRRHVDELRQQAEIQNGISSDDLQEGDALQLSFADDSFDWVVETGVLHHIRHWPQAVAEMARVARYGVLIAGTNNTGLIPYRKHSMNTSHSRPAPPAEKQHCRILWCG